MRFGITIAPHIDRWDLIQYAEGLGYDRAWVPDSQMIWSDCYALLALAAVNTKRIQIGTGVSITGTRGDRALHRHHQSTRAWPRIPGSRHRAHGDAGDGAGADAGQ